MTASLSHEVSVLCRCDDLEHCLMERYISDVRIAYRQVLLFAALVVTYMRQIQRLTGGSV